MNSLLCSAVRCDLPLPESPHTGGTTSIDPHYGAVREQRMGEIYGTCWTVTRG